MNPEKYMSHWAVGLKEQGSRVKWKVVIINCEAVEVASKVTILHREPTHRLREVYDEWCCMSVVERAKAAGAPITARSCTSNLVPVALVMVMVNPLLVSVRLESAPVVSLVGTSSNPNTTGAQSECTRSWQWESQLLWQATECCWFSCWLLVSNEVAMKWVHI